MNPERMVGTPEPLKWWLDRLGEFPGDGWLVVKRGMDALRAVTLCWPIIVRGVDCSPEEEDIFDRWMAESDYASFLCEEQLEGIVANLAQQKADYTSSDVVYAVEYYWKNDAFCDLNSA